MLRLFTRRGLITPEAAAEMRRWDHGGGFSLHAAVRVEATDRKGLERLFRYCARPIFASERLLFAHPAERRGQGRAPQAAPRMQRLIYQLPKPRPDGQTALSLTPMEFLERLVTLIRPE